MKVRGSTQAWLAASAITATLFPQVSCSPISSSPPPFVPYKELSRDEIAKVDYAVGNIRASQHGAVPAIIVLQSPPLDPYASNRHAILTIENEVNCKLAFYVKGPKHWVFAVGARQSERLNLEAGKYTFAVDTHECSSDAPLYGEGNLRPQHSYFLSLTRDDVGRGGFQLDNNTGQPVQLSIAGQAYPVQARYNLELPAGPQTAIVESKCGKIVQDVKIKPNVISRLTVWCSEAERIQLLSPGNSN